MSHPQTDADTQRWCSQKHSITRKETAHMPEENIPTLARLYGSERRQRERGSMFAFVDTLRSESHPTLTHQARNERNRKGAGLTHLFGHERPWRTCGAQIFN